MPQLPVVDWTDAPADLNGLVPFAERRNLVSARVPSHFNWPLPHYIWTPHHVKRQLLQQVAAQERWSMWENTIMLVMLMIKWLKLDSDSFALNTVLFISKILRCSETFICHNCSSSGPHYNIQWEYFPVAIEFVKHTWALSSYPCTKGFEWNLSTNHVLSIIDWWMRNSRTLFRYKWTTSPRSRKSYHSGLLADSLSDPCITWEVWKGKFYPVRGHEGTEVE